MWRAMQRLNLRYRNILALRCLDGLSYAEIAEVLGVTVPAVESLLVRAKRGLEEKLRPHQE